MVSNFKVISLSKMSVEALDTKLIFRKKKAREIDLLMDEEIHVSTNVYTATLMISY